jgi:5-methylcytosine-specific restriction endonuclease McrA
MLMKQNQTRQKAKRSHKEEAKRRKREEKRSRGFPGIDYRARNAALRTLGFDTYAEYLDSKLWKGIREQVLERDNHRCRLCNLPAYSVHHASYGKAVLLGLELKWLAAICPSCHRQIEFTVSSRKRTSEEVGEEYRKLRRRIKAIIFFGVQLMTEDEPDLDSEFRAIIRDSP